MSLRSLAIPRFPPDQEVLYQHEHIRFFLPLIRIAILISILLYLAFFGWDIAQTGADLQQTLTIRVGFSLFAASVFVLTFTDLFIRYSQLVLTVYGVVCAAGVALIITIIPNGLVTGIAGVCLALMNLCTLFALQFRFAAVAVAIVVALTNVLVPWGTSERPNWFVYLNANFFLLSFVIAGLLFCWMIESTLRSRFREAGTLRVFRLAHGPHPPAAHGAPAGTGIFICYGRAETGDVTGRIYDRLIDWWGRDCVFKDVDDLSLGADFRSQLASWVAKASIVLVVIGRGWSDARRAQSFEEDFVRMEIEVALEHGVLLVPVLVQNAPMPLPGELPDSIRALAFAQAAVVRSDPDFHADMDRLIREISKVAPRSEEPRAAG